MARAQLALSAIVLLFIFMFTITNYGRQAKVETVESRQLRKPLLDIEPTSRVVPLAQTTTSLNQDPTTTSPLLEDTTTSSPFADATTSSNHEGTSLLLEVTLAGNTTSSWNISLSTLAPTVQSPSASSNDDSYATTSSSAIDHGSSKKLWNQSTLGSSSQPTIAIDTVGNLTAVCLVGYGRSLKFAGLRHRIRTHVFGPLGGSAKLFALIWMDSEFGNHPLLAVPEQKRFTVKAIRQMLPSSRDLAQLEFHSQGLSQDVPKINDRCEVGWQSLRTATARRYQVDGINILQSWLAQWGKLSKCMHMVEAHEIKQQMKFDFVMRLRPDMLFLQDIAKPREILGKASIAVPLGIGGKHKFNDHAVVCRRKACSAYFLPVDDYRICKGIFKNQFQYDLALENGIQAPAQNRIKHEHWDVVHSTAFVYTLMRDRTHGGNPGCSADCMRLAQKDAHTKFISECLAAEKKVCSSASSKKEQ